MYLKSCCALFLLALVACQAAPSPKVIEKSISEAETTFAKNAVLQEETGADKGRSKKSTTTFCVEVHSGKPEKVPCRQEVRQELAKPIVLVQPVPVPAPVVEYQMYREPIAIPPPSPSITLNQQQQQQQQSQAVNYPQPAPVPVPAPVQTPAPAPSPIINIVPQAPAAPAPCDKQIVQPQQPQQIHTVHHVIHPQFQSPQQPSVIQPQKPEKLALPKPQELNCIPQRPTCRKCNGLLPPSEPLRFIVQPVQPRPAFFNVGPINPKDKYNTQETNYSNVPSTPKPHWFQFGLG